MKLRLEKLIIFCADVKKLVDFYQKHFGLTLIGAFDEGWAVLDAGGIHIAFHKIGEQFAVRTTEEFQSGNSNVKLVLEVETGLANFRQKLLDDHVDIGEIKHFSGYPYLVCDGYDPEGNVFQLIHYLP